MTQEERRMVGELMNKLERIAAALEEANKWRGLIYRQNHNERANDERRADND